jgi:hypothetical protein
MSCLPQTADVVRAQAPFGWGPKRQIVRSTSERSNALTTTLSDDRQMTGIDWGVLWS